MSKEIFDLQQIHNDLLILKKESKSNDNYDVINYVMNKLNTLFTDTFKNMPTDIMKDFQQEIHKLNIKYVPQDCHLSTFISSDNGKQQFSKELNKAQKEGLTYFKNIHIGSKNICPLKESDVMTIIGDLDNNICNSAEEIHEKLCSCVKEPLSSRIHMYILRHIDVTSHLIYLIFIILAISIIFAGTTVISAQDKMTGLINTKEYSRIVKYPKFRSKYKKIQNERSKYKYPRHYKEFVRARNNLTKNQKERLDDYLPEYVQRNIMIESISFSFLSNFFVYVIISAIIVYSIRKHQLNRLKLTNFLAKIGKTFSVQIVSGIGIYSIVLNFTKNAFSEPNLIIDVIIYIIIIMYVVFTINTISELCYKKN